MMLWTWQSADFDPFTDRVDRSKSDFSNHHPDLLRAYTELDALLALSAEMKHQYVWCFTTDSWDPHPWAGRILWPVEVPEAAILSFVDGQLWERLIGNHTPPEKLQDSWRQELWSLNVYEKPYVEEVEKRKRAYLAASPPREELLRAVLIPKGPGMDILALVRTPLQRTWICPYDGSQLYARNALRARASSDGRRLRTAGRANG